MKAALATVSGLIVYMAGAFSEVVLVLLVLMTLDFFSGILRGIVTKTLNSTVGLAGIIKKIAVLVLLVMATVFDYLFMHVGQDTNGLILFAVCNFFIVIEGISILENVAQTGLPIPPVMYLALEKLNKDPYGKESRLARDPEMEKLDKRKLVNENQELLKRVRKLNDPEETPATVAEIDVTETPFEEDKKS